MMPRCIGISALLALGIACSDQPGFDSFRERAAKIGHREYQNELGKVYQVGSEGETNFISALNWYIAAATPTNHVVQEKENLVDIVGRYKLKSSQIKASNKGLDLQNLEVGTKLTIPGLPEAMYNAGALYEIGGNGVDRNFAEAAKWYHHGAEAGYPEAQFSYGYALEKGQGVFTDYKKAANWYKLSAEQGLPVAQSNLANLYFHGLGVKKNFSEAYKWFGIAKKFTLALRDTAKGDLDSKENGEQFDRMARDLDRLNKEVDNLGKAVDSCKKALPPEELIRVQRLIDSFAPTKN